MTVVWSRPPSVALYIYTHIHAILSFPHFTQILFFPLDPANANTLKKSCHQWEPIPFLLHITHAVLLPFMNCSGHPPIHFLGCFCVHTGSSPASVSQHHSRLWQRLRDILSIMGTLMCLHMSFVSLYVLSIQAANFVLKIRKRA